MDPDQALRDIRAALTDVRQAAASGDRDAEREAALRVAESTEALDEWLSRGGFAPSEWHDPLHDQTLTALHANANAEEDAVLAELATRAGIWWALPPNVQMAHPNRERRAKDV